MKQKLSPQFAYLSKCVLLDWPEPQSKAWLQRFSRALDKCSDPPLAVSKLMRWLLTDKNGVLQDADAQGKQAIEQVASLYTRHLAGHHPHHSEWEAAFDFARKAEEDAPDPRTDAAAATAVLAASVMAHPEDYAAAGEAVSEVLRWLDEAYSQTIADRLIQFLEAVA